LLVANQKGQEKSEVANLLSNEFALTKKLCFVKKLKIDDGSRNEKVD
jgi:hypothetical protein